MVGCLITADTIYWPAFIIATLAAVVASQATISATYSIVKQALALGCFPRVSVVHTSKKFLGQIYIPDINWILMILCIAVTAGFKNKIQIANAYGELYFSQLSLHLERITEKGEIRRVISFFFCVNHLNFQVSQVSKLLPNKCR
jgi:K+ transporter